MSKPSAGSSECVVTPSPAEDDLAVWQRRIGRQRERRLGTDELWGKLDDIVSDARPKVTRHGHHRSQALKSGRTRTELLEATLAQTRRLVAPGALEQACTTQAMAPGAFGRTCTTQAPGALEQAYTTQSGAGLIAIELQSGKIEHQSLSFQDLTSWIPVEVRGIIQASMDARDGDDFNSFCQRVVWDADEPYRETFPGRDAVVGRSITVRFSTRAPGPPGLQNPEWLLMVRPVTLTLVGVQPRQLESAAAGMSLPFLGQGRITEAIGVFAADLSGGAPSQWTLQVAHARYLLDCGLASGTWNMEVGNEKPLELIATLFACGVSKDERGGGGVFFRVTAQLDYAATSVLNTAQRSASWLTRKALRIKQLWTNHLNDDDTVSVSFDVFFTIFGGLSSSVSLYTLAGKGFVNHGGLGAMFFVADPAQPLDRNLRAAMVWVAPSTKTRGAFDVLRPYIFSSSWGSDIHCLYCKRLDTDTVGKKVALEEDVSSLFERLRVSPGVGLSSDGCSTICVGAI